MLVVDIDVRRDQGRKRSDRLRSDIAVGTVESGIQRGQIRGADLEIVHLAALVADLTFEPEHAEVVSDEGVDVVAHLVVEAERIVERRVGRDQRRSSCRGLRRRVVDEQVGVLILREEDAAFDADVAGAVAGHGRRGNRGCRNGGEKIFSH
jgi:hypothetical protein